MLFGISSVCNIIGAVKAANVLKPGTGKNVVAIATGGFGRYPCVMRRLDQAAGKMTKDEAKRRRDIFRKADIDKKLAKARGF